MAGWIPYDVKAQLYNEILFNEELTVDMKELHKYDDNVWQNAVIRMLDNDVAIFKENRRRLRNMEDQDVMRSMEESRTAALLLLGLSCVEIETSFDDVMAVELLHTVLALSKRKCDDPLPYTLVEMAHFAFAMVSEVQHAIQRHALQSDIPGEAESDSVRVPFDDLSL